MSHRSHASVEAGTFATQIDRATRGKLRSRAFGFLSLFTSFGTLICCALPSVLVLLGLGATVASLLSAAPWLVTLSRHKAWVFAGSGTFIALNSAYVYSLAPTLRGANQSCPPDAAAVCGTADRLNRVVLWVSAAIWAVGFLAAYALGPILAWSE